MVDIRLLIFAKYFLNGAFFSESYFLMGQSVCRSILFLGLPSSGKTTATRLIKLYTAHMSHDEVAQTSMNIRQSILTNMQDISNTLERMDLDMESKNRKKMRYVVGL